MIVQDSIAGAGLLQRSHRPAKAKSRPSFIWMKCGSQESVQMWNKYISDGMGVIVKTTLKQFDEALGWTTPQHNKSATPIFATISYMDRDSFFFVNDGHYHLLTIKGEGFKHEREVRLIAKSPSLVRAIADHASPTREEITELVAAAGKGFNLVIDVKRLVTEIRVHPSAPSEYIEEIRRLVASKQLSLDLVNSSELPKHG